MLYRGKEIRTSQDYKVIWATGKYLYLSNIYSNRLPYTKFKIIPFTLLYVKVWTVTLNVQGF